MFAPFVLNTDDFSSKIQPCKSYIYFYFSRFYFFYFHYFPRSGLVFLLETLVVIKLNKCLGGSKFDR